ncbi:LPS export ABC transporter permease LptG [Psychrobacter sp. HD31]|uniref:LPS export ABC transporter permease LptG n=1 Tax=Psychrobacter sp. HD31 TaxID=3112003 RepID=UPI003DA4B152
MAMRVLSRYVKKNAFFAIVAAVLGLWLLQVVFSYLAELENISDSYTMRDALTYIFYKSPHFLEQFIPTGALLGAVVGLGLLANNSELTVMQASGVSKTKIVSWVLQPAIIFVFIALAINQFVLPTSNHLADLVDDDNNKRDVIEKVEGYWTVQPRYIDGSTPNSVKPDGRDVLYIDYADIEGNIGLVKRWHLDNAGNLQSASIARGGNYVGAVEVKDPHASDGFSLSHQWQLNDLSELKIGQSLATSQTRQVSDILGLPIEPQSVYLLTREAEDLSLTQLYDHRQFMQSQGNRSLEHELAFWQKLLSPLSILSLVIVACSFVFGSLRTHSLGLRVVVALLFGLFFSYMQDLVGFISLATGVSPLLMVLLPIIASGLFGLWLLQRKT